MYPLLRKERNLINTAQVTYAKLSLVKEGRRKLAPGLARLGPASRSATSRRWQLKKLPLVLMDQRQAVTVNRFPLWGRAGRSCESIVLYGNN